MSQITVYISMQITSGKSMFCIFAIVVFAPLSAFGECFVFVLYLVIFARCLLWCCCLRLSFCLTSGLGFHPGAVLGFCRTRRGKVPRGSTVRLTGAGCVVYMDRTCKKVSIRLAVRTVSSVRVRVSWPRVSWPGQPCVSTSFGYTHGYGRS